MDIEGFDRLQFIKLLKCNTYSIPSQLLTPRHLNENHICFGSPATKTSRCLIKTPQLSSIKDLSVSLKKYFQGLVETVAPQLCPQQETSVRDQKHKTSDTRMSFHWQGLTLCSAHDNGKHKLGVYFWLDMVWASPTRCRPLGRPRMLKKLLHLCIPILGRSGHLSLDCCPHDSTWVINEWMPGWMDCLFKIWQCKFRKYYRLWTNKSQCDCNQ